MLDDDHYRQFWEWDRALGAVWKHLQHPPLKERHDIWGSDESESIPNNDLIKLMARTALATRVCPFRSSATMVRNSSTLALSSINRGDGRYPLDVTRDNGTASIIDEGQWCDKFGEVYVTM